MKTFFFPLHLCFLSTSSDSLECGCSSDIGFIVRTARSVPTRCGRTRACVSDSTTFQATCCHPPLSDFNALEVFLCPERVSHGSTVPALVWTEPTLRPFLAMTLRDVVCSLLLKGKKKYLLKDYFVPPWGSVHGLSESFKASVLRRAWPQRNTTQKTRPTHDVILSGSPARPKQKTR